MESPLVRTPLPPTVTLESGEGRSAAADRRQPAGPRADLPARRARHGVAAGGPRTRALDEPPEPVGRGEADPRRRAHLLPLVRAAPDRQIRARTRVRPTAGLDARRGARRRARRHAPGLPAHAAGAAAPGLAARLRRDLPRDRRLVAGPGARGPQLRERRVLVRGGAAHLLRRAGRARHRDQRPRGDRLSRQGRRHVEQEPGAGTESGSQPKPTAST